jgi:hypothetical protein
MADNTKLNSGSTGDSIRDIDKGGVKTQVVTLDVGGAGAESLVAGTVPVSGSVTANAGTNLNTSALALEVGGNLAAIKTDVDKLPADPAREGGNLATIAGKDFATQTTLALIKAKTDNLDVLLSTRTKPADTQTVSGTVTANAGTNLNTSSLALEVGGNLAAINTNEGATTDAAVTSDVSGTIAAKLRGLVKILADIWDSANHRVKVDGSGVTQPVSGTFWQATQPVSGTVTANAGTNLNTSALALEAGGNLAAIKTDVDKIPSQGQALAAASMPVVLTAAQVTTLTPPAAITGFALESGGHLAAIDTSTTKIPAQGQALSSASMPVVLPATQITTLTPPAAITGFALDATIMQRLK